MFILYLLYFGKWDQVLNRSFRRYSISLFLFCVGSHSFMVYSYIHIRVSISASINIRIEIYNINWNHMEVSLQIHLERFSVILKSLSIWIIASLNVSIDNGSIQAIFTVPPTYKYILIYIWCTAPSYDHWIQYI